MYTVTSRFEEVSFTATKTGKCPSCGKSVRRAKRFEQTINPFNKNSEGKIKDRREIQTELHAEAEAWEPDFRHNTEKCRA